MSNGSLLRRVAGRRLWSLIGLFTVAMAGLGYAAQQVTPAKVVPRQSAIVPAPAFTGAQLGVQPTVDWPTTGGSTTNDRFSALNLINATNVGQLKGVWLTKLRGSGAPLKYSQESQPVEYQGTIYISTGNDDVFAISVATGKILWEYQSHINQKISTVCCGWDNRGVAIGDGRVYIGELDDHVVALNQLTGAVEWNVHLAGVTWQSGATVTSSPLYIDNTIYIGDVGAEYGERPFMEALNATTGKEMWRFYVDPAPHSPGGNTWPNNGTYLHGGGSIWSNPAYDPATGLLYFSTGNAGPWWGGNRKGKNLFTVSIVAVKATTGQLAGWYQEVHHDIWDYDTPSPVVLFNATVNGKIIRGIAHPSKVGWLYLINRVGVNAPVRSMSPLYNSIKETPVPQSSWEATYPTQPIPQVGRFIPAQDPPPAGVIQSILKLRQPVEKVLPYKVATSMYTPFEPGQFLIYGPTALGADSWMPSSYNPNTQMSYVCGSVAYWGADEVIPKPYVPGQTYVGLTDVVSSPRTTGTVTAINDTNGKVMWQQTWGSECRSGTVTTAGNIVFVGDNAGQFEALNALTGKTLWSFQTGAGANDTPAVFQYNGQEYVAFLAGGQLFGTTAHGDNMWLFGLNGTMGPVAAGKIPKA
ncbi:MAG TPA: PQQ-binding-like beta-propeller repeat protein [Verrucomicrobiae bacterium]|nr:PQQ-binding-like beta-propeller repeat protein [Verrucomicrobiae bacterium]